MLCGALFFYRHLQSMFSSQIKSNLTFEVKVPAMILPHNVTVTCDMLRRFVLMHTRVHNGVVFCFCTAPISPSYIHVVNQTQTIITIEWGLPDMVNGVLRSFLVNVEEVESFNSTECCQYFPVQEVTVKSEKSNYQFEVSFTNDKSTYYIQRIVSNKGLFHLAVHANMFYSPFFPPNHKHLKFKSSNLLT
jgi:hypothetical protein